MYARSTPNAVHFVNKTLYIVVFGEESRCVLGLGLRYYPRNKSNVSEKLSGDGRGTVYLRRFVLLGMVIAFVGAMVAIPAIAQTPPTATVTEDVNAKGGPMPEAKAGGATAKGGPCPEAKAGDVTAQGGCKPPPPPPPPPAPAPKASPAPAPAPAPAPPAPQAKVLPPSGGVSSAALLGLGAGALLVGGGLLVRRFNR